MIALGKHLGRHEQDPGGPLPFRRDCPVCRGERVVGTLPDDRIVSVNAGVTFAIGALLTGGLVPPGSALADRGDGSGEGVAVEVPPVPAPPSRGTTPAHALGSGAAPVEDADDDPPREQHGRGRDEAAAPPRADRAQMPPTPAASADETPPHERNGRDEPAASPRPAQPVPEPQPRHADGHQTRPNAGSGAARPAGRVAIPTPAVASPPRATAPTAGRPQPRGTAGTSSPHGARPAPRPGRTGAGRQAAPESRGTASQGAPASTAGSAPKPRSRGDEMPESTTYVVREGDCLWRIAAHRLGNGANDAAIAKEVTRLWKLNAKRIGTGDPDLIFPGQTLTF